MKAMTPAAPFDASPTAAEQPPLHWLQALVLLLVIGPQWLVTRDLFDGSTVALASALNNPDGLYFWLSNANWLLAVLFFKLCFAVAHLAGIDYLPIVKLAVTGMLLGMYSEFASLARRLFGLAPREAGLVGLLCLASPSIYIFVNSGAVPILVCVWLMFLGHRLFWHGRLSVRLAGLAVLAASFQLNSNLVLALALEVVYLYRQYSGGGPWRARIKWFVLLALTAVSVYGTMRLLAPPRQMFVEYNQLLNPLRADDARRMVRATAMFMTWGIIPLSVLALVAVAGGLARGRGAAGTAAWRPASEGFALLAALFLCAAAIFPYVMVGKGPPLFAYLGLGDGLTEQVLRASHAGPLAPTWANTSARHGLLFAPMLALLTWFLARALLRRLQGAAPRLGTTGLFLLALPVFLFWLLPAYHNKMQMQHAEVSLARGLKALPPAPPGVVELRYAPVSDWLIWSNAATGILREAWGQASYYAMFYSIDAYRDDMQWQYHAYFKNHQGMKSDIVQHSVGMAHFPGEDCITRYEAVLPQASLATLLLTAFRADAVEPAQVRLVDSRCAPGQQLRNPMPDRKAIL